MKTNIAPEIKAYNQVVLSYIASNPDLIGPNCSLQMLYDAMDFFEDKYRMFVDERSICLDFLKGLASETLAGLAFAVEKCFLQIDLDDDQEVEDYNLMYRAVLESWKRAHVSGFGLFQMV